MTIRVTCSGCYKRFDVSEQFAGKEGPCPSCKKVIQIPSPKEDVVIHAPPAGPKDSTGRPTLKPIARQETNLSGVQMTLIGVTIFGFFAGSFITRLMLNGESGFPWLLLVLGALFVAIPTVLAGYTFLRNQELGRFVGKDLVMRVCVCAGVYALLWLLFPLMKYTFDGYQLGAWITAVVAMIAVGGATAMLSLDLDYLIGVMHYGIYFGCCLVARLIVGIGVLPGMNEASVDSNSTTISSLWPLFQDSLGVLLSV